MKKKVLYFIKGPVPTKEEAAAKEKIEGAVFRNALAVAVGDSLESCTGIAGAIPEAYKILLPKTSAKAE